MTIRRVAAFALVVVFATNAVAPAADEPKLPDVKTFDKLVIDTLRAVHNTGADLYNEKKDFPGAYHVYQGALITIRPLLAHRPDAQKLIDTGFADADKETDLARKAFVLHVAIEGVRKNLKDTASEKKPLEPPVKKPEEPKKPSGLPIAPPPKEVKPK